MDEEHSYIYKGSWKNGVKEGLAKFVSPKEDVIYIGEMKNGQRHG